MLLNKYNLHDYLPLLIGALYIILVFKLIEQYITLLFFIIMKTTKHRFKCSINKLYFSIHNSSTR